ncbi:MAG: hypothetical protein WB992_19325 [Bryobacteraceae bacterium]
MSTTAEGTGSSPLGEVVDVRVLGENAVEPERAPLGIGSRIRWTNNTDQSFVIRFHHGSPFEGGTETFDLPPNGTALSGPISKHTTKGELKYQVRSADEVELEGLQTPPQDPTIIIRDPH